jgi:hypothetical protein
LSDAADRGPQCSEQRFIAPARRTPALQQIHLHEMHGIDIGIAQHDGPLQRRVIVDETGGAAKPQHVVHGQLEFLADGSGLRAQGIARQGIVMRSDL